MFGFVKEVFNCCAENWSPETQMKELDFVRKIFAASEDFEGKGLHAKAEEVLSMLAKKLITPSEATSSMLQFFKCEILFTPLHSSMSYYELELSKCITACFNISTSTIMWELRHFCLLVRHRFLINYINLLNSESDFMSTCYATTDHFLIYFFLHAALLATFT